MVQCYGWEWQIAETTMLAVFVAPWFQFQAVGEPPIISVWLLRFLAFRLMWGAGMSKLGTHASPCWRYPHFSCTTTHYETQPLPSPVAFFLHRLPFRLHQAEVLFNHLVELILPYGYLIPFSSTCGACGLLSIGYMFAIIISGSYATINWISIVDLLFTMDDRFLCQFLPHFIVSWRDRVALSESSVDFSTFLFSLYGIQFTVSVIFAVWFLYISIPSIKESLSPSPWLNFYNPYYLGNSYGVFGFVNSKRYVVIMSLQTVDGKWHELVYKILPSDVKRRPAYSAPYHYRLDWQVWIETTASLESRMAQDRPNIPFVPPLLREIANRLMSGDIRVAALFHNGEELLKNSVEFSATKFELYLYQYAPIRKLFSSGTWWDRHLIQSRIVPCTQGLPIDKEVRKEAESTLSIMNLTTFLFFLAAAIIFFQG
eukprot:TRINITY_DN2920_c0_g1_i31.p1 TRINITY_DN2920_c0_g1~~TRINITY_DN2920_c0_g1_i31.p1  ORF type:complete len:428 (-),score=51.56 TRINITY_DN2920_c0_g1_i31:186-1469(-)